MLTKVIVFVFCALIVVNLEAEGQTVLKKKRNQCDYEQPPCGLCGRLINVTLIARNTLKEPNFELTANVIRIHKRELLSYLNEAVKINSGFRYTATYSGNDYTIDTINGLPGSKDSQTYWQIISYDTPLECGILTYIPRNEETVVFNYTSSTETKS